MSTLYISDQKEYHHMLTALTLQQSCDFILAEQSTDDLQTHLLAAHPDSNSWAVVSLRSTLSVAMAVAAPGFVPVCLIATIEALNLRERVDFAALEIALLDKVAARATPFELISFLECHNTMTEHIQSDD